ncbi:MAG: glutamate 5-kinase [Kofleriaceae bacterium]|nr:glutamate 5-kinase [Kofleriaceae bacterium]MBP6836282.1 glutamate 5-kinase [Kofleriaceae bacterium]MBP9204640.1 glutamate 5-kinase [Kofleriaceae bacterium]
MSEPRAELARCRRLVVKIGSRLLAESPAGRPAALADQIHALRQRGVEVVVVSSGAIALGVRALALPGRPSELPQLQAAAAAGQSRLMQHWEHAFSVHGTVIGQVLLTHDDLGDRRRFLSARQTLRALLDLGAVPIINENDTVATDEIKFGDNDQLAALVCNLVSADLLVILTDVEGVRGTDGVRMPIVVDIDREAAPAAGASRGDGVGSGGMASKVASARIVTRTGVPTVVAPGRHPTILPDLLAGADLGTLFVPAGDTLSSRKHWIAYGAKPAGRLTVDAGAARAVCEHGRSLLPAGITAVEGGFGMGETVAVVGADGRELARGLTAYDADDLRKILGLHSADIEATLGLRGPAEAIHRDDLVIL